MTIEKKFNREKMQSKGNAIERKCNKEKIP